MSAPTAPFEVTVLLFGSAAANANAPSVEVHLKPGATAADLLAALKQQHPMISAEVSVGRIAIDHAFAAPTTPIEPAHELALISMVSGG